MKRIFITLVVICAYAIGYAQTDYFLSPTGSGTMDGTSWEDAADASSHALITQFLGTLPPHDDANLHFMEGDYYDFQIFINFNPSINSIAIYGGYASFSTGTDLTNRDANTYPTIFHATDAPIWLMDPFQNPYTTALCATIFIDLQYNGFPIIIDGVELNGSDIDPANTYYESAIVTFDCPTIISNCKVYEYPIRYELIYMEHADTITASTIIDCEIFNNTADVVLSYACPCWIENCTINDNYLTTDFIFDNNGSGPYTDINNTFFSNYVNGNLINSSKPSLIISQSNNTLHRNSLNSNYTDNELVDLSLYTIDGRLMYHKRIHLGEYIETNVDDGIYIAVLHFSDGHTTTSTITTNKYSYFIF